jgi:NTE family protein
MPKALVSTTDVSARLRSPVHSIGGDEKLEKGVGLCLSGGGYRAMLFHLGTLWRLNELGWLPKLTRIASVSGGSITAGVLAQAWGSLDFKGDVAQHFVQGVVEPVRRMADTSIDVSSVLTGVFLPGDSIADRVAKRYDKVLFRGATLQDLPAAPEFIICATNVQTGSLVRFSRKRVGDWQVGEVPAPRIPLAQAVAASSAFPPVLSPAELTFPEGAMRPVPGGSLNVPPYCTEMVLTDGGIYDNLGLETVWKRCKTVLVSDAGQKMAADPTPSDDWVRHLRRVLDLVDNQVRNLRKRQVVESYLSGARKGAYWGVRSDITKYPASKTLPCPLAQTHQLAAVPTRLTATDAEIQERLINWGYAICDAAMRAHVQKGVVPAPAFPYTRGVA